MISGEITGNEFLLSDENVGFGGELIESKQELSCYVGMYNLSGL